MINVKKCMLGAGLFIAVLGPCIAAAALGEPEVSVDSDVAQLHASIKINSRTGYRVHELELPSGTRLREFAGTDGKVFAVAWNGPTIPDLRQAFGRYFDSYVTAAKNKHAGHNQLQITLGDLVVQSGGHMRAFAGRAYLPQSIPSGVDIGELQ
jgi:Protein of unknown function (DUF2844)